MQAHTSYSVSELKLEALGIRETGIYGPEVGVLGLILNIVFATVLWQYWKVRAAKPA